MVYSVHLRGLLRNKARSQLVNPMLGEFYVRINKTFLSPIFNNVCVFTSHPIYARSRATGSTC